MLKLEKIYFEGNAPSVFEATNDSPSFDADVTLYYLTTTTGWTDSEYYDAETGTWNGYKLEVWPEGYTVSGTITSFLSDTETITVQVLNGDAEVFSTTVTGITATYTIEDIEAGTYTLRLSKANHVTREYEVVVDTENVTQDAKIHPVGDINCDGKITVVDAARANSHAKKVTFLTGYELACADVTGEGNVTIVDAARINSHAKKVTFIW